MSEPSSIIDVYQLQVWLCEISPLIWRRLLVRSDSTIVGSDIHVMLALRRNSFQVVVADEELDGPDMVGELFGEGQRLADETRNPLVQRVVKPLEVVGFPRQLADRAVVGSRNDPCVHHC